MEARGEYNKYYIRPSKYSTSRIYASISEHPTNIWKRVENKYQLCAKKDKATCIKDSLLIACKYKALHSKQLKNENKTLNRDRLICKEKEGVEVNELFLNQYNVIKFSLLWKCEICIYAQWNIDELWLCLLHLSQRKKSGYIIY